MVDSYDKYSRRKRLSIFYGDDCFRLYLNGKEASDLLRNNSTQIEVSRDEWERINSATDTKRTY